MSALSPDALETGTLERAFAFSQQQVRHLVETHPDYFPLYTAGGKWRHDGELWCRWGEGFLGGMMWLFYKRTRDEDWLEHAKRYSRLIEHRKDDRKSQSHASLFLSTYRHWHELLGDARALEVLIDGAESTLSRFNARGGYLASFVAPESCLIDNMMSVRDSLLCGGQNREYGDARRGHSLLPDHAPPPDARGWQHRARMRF